MAHSVGEQAARAVKNSQKTVAETRTPEEILKTIRGNIAAHLFVTPTDQRFLLEQYDAAITSIYTVNRDHVTLRSAIEAQDAYIADLQAEIVRLNEQIEQFRTVYEQENRNQTLRVDVLTETDPEAAL